MEYLYFWLLVMLCACLFTSFLFRWRNDLNKNRNPDVDFKFLFCQ